MLSWTQMRYSVAMALFFVAPLSLAESSSETCRAIEDGEPLQAIAAISRGEIAAHCDPFQLASYYHQIDVLKALTSVPKILQEAKKSSRIVSAAISRSQLELGSEKGPLETIEFLLDFDFPVNRTPDTNRSPLHFAASQGFVTVAKYLIAHGAEVNAPNELGNTPLHEAVTVAAIGRTGVDQKTRRTMIELLLTSGAKVAVLNRCHVSALDIARTNDKRRGSNISQKDTELVLAYMQRAAKKQNYMRPKLPQLKPDFPECT